MTLLFVCKHKHVGYHNLQNLEIWVPTISHPEHCSGHLRAQGSHWATTAELELSTPEIMLHTFALAKSLSPPSCASIKWSQWIVDGTATVGKPLEMWMEQPLLVNHWRWTVTWPSARKSRNRYYYIVLNNERYIRREFFYCLVPGFFPEYFQEVFFPPINSHSQTYQQIFWCRRKK
jgi:hypothetical protein